jgi:hypothetical protein
MTISSPCGVGQSFCDIGWSDFCYIALRPDSQNASRWGRKRTSPGQFFIHTIGRYAHHAANSYAPMSNRDLIVVAGLRPSSAVKTIGRSTHRRAVIDRR